MSALELDIFVSPMPVGWDEPESPLWIAMQSGKADLIDGEVEPDGVRFVVEIEVKEGAEEPDFRGVLVHGKRGDRFLYIVWGYYHEGERHRSRRLKVYLSPVVRKDFSSDGISWAQARRGSVTTVACGRADDGCPLSGTAHATWR